MTSGDRVTRVVPKSLSGVRLDRALAALLPDVSRAEIARWANEGRILVDGVARARNDKLREGAVIQADPAPPPPSDATPDASVVFEVLYEDKAIVVVNKPAGLVVHPARGHREGTLVNGLLARGSLPASALLDDAEGDDPIATSRPGIVHRIDKGTSGVMVVAKTAIARERLKAIFAAHDLDRVYDGLAVGTLSDEATFDTIYGRHPSNRLAFTSKNPSGIGKRACTHVNVVERVARSLVARVECTLETGRTHQIRVHLAENGAPLLGDALYSRGVVDAEIKAIGERLGRQGLHARRLGFVHPTTKKSVVFEAPWPDDLRVAYESLVAIDTRERAATAAGAKAPAPSKRGR